MAVKVTLHDKNKELLHSEEMYGNEFEAVEEESVFLITARPHDAHGQFRAEQITTQTTTILATPEGGGSVLITDVVIGAKKVTNSVITLQFNDGTRQEILFEPDSHNAPVNFSWTPGGRIQGWSAAQLEVVTSGANPDVTITIGYMKLLNGLEYSAWNAIR